MTSIPVPSDLHHYAEGPERLDICLKLVAEYYFHNHRPDFKQVAAVLRENGYVEPVVEGPFYRALTHQVTAPVLMRHSTVAEWVDELSEGYAFEKGDYRSFAETQRGSANYLRFAEAVSGYKLSREPDAGLESVRDVTVIYQATAPVADIVFSTKGIERLLELHGHLSDMPGWTALSQALYDPIDPRAGEDEVVVHTRSINILGGELWSHGHADSL